ncbi:zinc finger protein 507-like [Sitodiplosis mosellana]|uniref:zinc finger protein 507-like n=1 Tax=Sitodiplosis mosellana TaxID=263140 RepID=UPI0024441C7C|nr:zinc finger protein 507-like [Sitodiplosis mosellana]
MGLQPGKRNAQTKNARKVNFTPSTIHKKQHRKCAKSALDIHKQVSTVNPSVSSPTWESLVERVRQQSPIGILRRKFAERAKRCELSTKDDSITVFIDGDPTEDTIVIVADQTADHSTQSESSIRVNDSYFQNYENVINTMYMEYCVRTIGKKFSRDFTISEYLSQEQQDQLEHLDKSSSTPSCTCCLCRLHVKSTVSHEFCIRKHPNQNPCSGDQPNKTNFMMKHQPRCICDECIDAIIFNAKKVKGTRRFTCCFDSCETTGLTQTALKNHCFQHFGVKKFMCPLCDFSHDRKPEMKRHERKHLKDSS